MIHINLNGLWIFVIVYGPEYGENANKELIFEAEFTQDGDTFTATGMDKDGVGMSPDLAHMKGFMDENMISFVKQYEFSHYTLDDGKTIVDKSNPGHEINYYGTYDEATNSFSGDWDITIRPSGFWYDMTCTGTWSMKRL